MMSLQDALRAGSAMVGGRRANDELKAELLRTQFMLWAVVRAAGGQVSVPQHVAESYRPNARLVRIPSADGSAILFRAEDAPA